MQVTLSQAAIRQNGRYDINVPLETNDVTVANILGQVVADYTADRRLTINKQEVPIQQAEERFREIYETRKDKTLFLIGAGMGAGVQKIGVVTDGMRREAAGGGGSAGGQP